MIPVNQTVTILFHTQANSAEVNKRHMDIRQLGIYSGGRLTVVDGPIHTASLSPLVCEISDGTHQVRVKINALANITVPANTPYVVLRWTYTGATSDLVQVLAVADPSAKPNDLVVGKRNLAGDLSGFVYGDTASPSYPRSTPNTQDLFLKVEPTENSELYVQIRAGKYQSASASVVVPDQKSDLFVAPAANSKVYLVYVTTNGTIEIDSSGTEEASPSPPDYDGKLVLAEITLASADTNITVDKIKDVRSFLSKPPASGITLANVDHYDSGWFAISANHSYTKNHGLSSIPKIVHVYISNTNVDGTGYYIQGVTGFNADAYSFGTYVDKVTITQIRIRTHQVLTQVVGWVPTSGYAKIIAIR